MFLTRMHLNPHRRGTRHLVASPQRLHAAVLCGFPPGLPTEDAEGRTLWRLDQGRQGALTLWVASPSAPDLTHLVEQAGWPTRPDPWESSSIRGLLTRINEGQRWAFRLTANPVHNRSRGEGLRGQPVAHVTTAQQETWLAERAAASGFAIDDGGIRTAHVSARRTVTFDRRAGGSRHRVTLSMATFDGALRVVDAEALRRTMCHGLGRAKGYGCGLLTLAPLT